MVKGSSKRNTEEMLPEYDFSRGVRGKYAERFTKDSIMVVLDPDVAAIFPDRKSVNTALRALGHVVRDRKRAPACRRASRACGAPALRLPRADCGSRLAGIGIPEVPGQAFLRRRFPDVRSWAARSEASRLNATPAHRTVPYTHEADESCA